MVNVKRQVNFVAFIENVLNNNVVMLLYDFHIVTHNNQGTVSVTYIDQGIVIVTYINGSDGNSSFFGNDVKVIRENDNIVIQHVFDENNKSHLSFYININIVIY